MHSLKSPGSRIGGVIVEYAKELRSQGVTGVLTIDINKQTSGNWLVWEGRGSLDPLCKKVKRKLTKGLITLLIF